MRNERLYNPEHLGTGALEFARSMLAGLPLEEIEEATTALVEGRLHDATDPRIKECGFCAFYYRDQTRPNNSKTCSPECKAGFDAERKREKRHAKGEINLYPAANYEKPYSPETLEGMHAKKLRGGYDGNRTGRRYARERRNADY